MRLPLRTKDFRRVEEVKRRDPVELSERLEKEKIMTDILARHEGSMELWPTQAFAL